MGLRWMAHRTGHMTFPELLSNGRPSTLKDECEFCGQEKSVEHVILYCQKYETERRILMQNLEKIKMQFKLRDILPVMGKTALLTALLFSVTSN